MNAPARLNEVTPLTIEFKLDQQSIPLVVAPTIVDCLEAVEVEEQHRKNRLLPSSFRDRPL